MVINTVDNKCINLKKLGYNRRRQHASAEGSVSNQIKRPEIESTVEIEELNGTFSFLN